jgi:ABC-type multidrug transport system fused ATPase/permease subunit
MIREIYKEYFYKNIKLYIVYGLCSLHIVLDKVALPHYYGKIISDLKDKKMDNIKFLFFVLVGLWIIIQALVSLGSYFHSVLLPRFIGFARTKLIKIIIDNYKHDFADLKMGKLLTKIIDSPYLLYDTTRNVSNFIFNNLITIMSTFFYLFYYNKIIGLIYLISVIVVFGISYIYYLRSKILVKKSEELYVDVYEEIEDTVSNLISIYTNNTTKEEKKRIKKRSDIADEADIVLYKSNTYFRIIYSIVFIIIFVVLNYFTFNLYMEKKLNSSTLVSIVIINYSILQELMMIYWNTRYLIDNVERINILSEYLDDMPKPNKITKIIEVNTNKLFQNSNDITIEIKNISFSYLNKQIFKNFNLLIKPKEKIALIGEIGSGKSTLSKLIIGLKSINSGEILINNVNLKSLNIDKLRNHITYIPQHPKLFNRTLYENITYGIKDAENNNYENKIYKILEANKLNDIKDIFKKNMHKNVGKLGSNLSGGQRQIVWIIRSILKDNKLIILDEPTSSLDSLSKKKIISLIKNLSTEKGIIIITHDKSLLENMNRIITLDKGRIISDIRT